MYNVNVNDRFSQVPSYEKAVSAAKTGVLIAAGSLRARATAIQSGNIYRSPKARNRVAADLRRSAENLSGAFKFPKKAGDLSQRACGVTVNIVKAN